MPDDELSVLILRVILIFEDHCQWVIEECAGLIKTDAVLAEMADAFRRSHSNRITIGWASEFTII